MNKAFVDSAAWLALFSEDDYLHSQALKTMLDLKKKKYHLTTTDFIFLEVADALSGAKFRTNAISYIQRLRQSKSLKVLPISTDLLEKGWQLYCSRLDKDWGLTDCTSFVVMTQENITTAFTSDRHFEQAGFVRLLNPNM